MRPSIIVTTVRAIEGCSATPSLSLSVPHIACRHSLILPPSSSSTRPRRLLYAQHRLLSTSRTLQKQKGGKQNTKQNVVHATERANSAGNDPSDFSVLEESIATTVTRLREDLARIQKGGRISTELVENLRAELKTSSGGGGGGPREDDEGGKIAKTKGAKSSSRSGKDKPGGQPRDIVSAKVGDLAQVVPKGGRSMVILVGEEAHVKPITNALLASPHNLNPVPNPHAPLELTLPIPPPTAESREQARKDAAKAGEKASMFVKEARGAQQKTLRAMDVAKTVRPDDLRKASERMEKKVQDAQAEVKKIVDGAKRALDS